MSVAALQALADVIAITRELLVRRGDMSVVQRLTDLEARLAAGDHSAVVSALSEAAGGMGSLNDRILPVYLVREIEVKAREAARELGIVLIR